MGNEIVKMELQITKIGVGKNKNASKNKGVSAKQQTPSLGQPRLLQAALTSSPGSTLGSGIPALKQLREKKKPRSTLPKQLCLLV